MIYSILGDNYFIRNYSLFTNILIFLYIDSSNIMQTISRRFFTIGFYYTTFLSICKLLFVIRLPFFGIFRPLIGAASFSPNRLDNRRTAV